MPNVAGHRRPGPTGNDCLEDGPRESTERTSTPTVVKAPARRRVPTSPVATRSLQRPGATSAEHADEPVEKPTARRHGHRQRAFIALLLVAVLGAGGWLTYLHTRPASRVQRPVVSDAGDYTPGTLADAGGQAALTQAAAMLPTVLSYDYRSLDAGLHKALADLTPRFAADFTTTFASVVRPVAAKNAAVVKALVRAAGLVDHSGDTATVLVFVDEALVSSGTKAAPKISQDRVRLTMLKSGGRWLIDSITPF